MTTLSRSRAMGIAVTVLGLLAMAPSAQAHFLWASFDPSLKTVSVGLQELPTDEPLPLAERAVMVQAWSKTKKAIKLQAEANWLKTPAIDACMGASLDYGVLDRSDQGRGVFWLHYFAKAATTQAASQQKLGLPVELTLSKDARGKMVVTVYRNGKLSPQADVVIELHGGKIAFEGKTGKDGQVQIPSSEGSYAIRGLVTENTKGSRDGKKYDLIRSYCTLSVGGVSQATTPKLTQLLKSAFGDNHDIVGHTAFVETLMSGKLTKPQLEAHFQQRALIHEAVDRILKGAKVPYGEEQARLVPLLRQDLVAMGSTWPTESQAWPLTQGILQEIRESAKKGPYFALGVHHVYYGGITHGGRDIGAKITKTLGVKQDYYLKTDGYPAYVKLVDQITDPEAQKEMIRGGVAAYRYIIAVNDAEVFKGVRSARGGGLLMHNPGYDAGQVPG